MTKIAVIKTGGKQYLVEEGKIVEIEKIKNANRENIEFKDVLLYADENDFLIGKPLLSNVLVSGKLIKGKKKKTVILKYKPKTRYRKKKGYKKITWLVEINKITKK